MAGEHRTEPEAMRSVVGNVGGIITHGINTVADLERLILQPMSFAALGSAVATASAALHSGQVCAVRTLLRLLQEINGLIKTTADETGAGTTSTASIWGNSPGSELATLAINDSAGAAGEPSSVGNVLRYLDIARLCRHPITAARFTGVADFNDWLTADAGNQARIGLIEVYAGTARTFGDDASSRARARGTTYPAACSTAMSSLSNLPRAARPSSASPATGDSTTTVPSTRACPGR